MAVVWRLNACGAQPLPRAPIPAQLYVNWLRLHGSLLVGPAAPTLVERVEELRASPRCVGMAHLLANAAARTHGAQHMRRTTDAHPS